MKRFLCVNDDEPLAGLIKAAFKEDLRISIENCRTYEIPGLIMKHNPNVVIAGPFSEKSEVPSIVRDLLRRGIKVHFVSGAKGPVEEELQDMEVEIIPGAIDAISNAIAREDG